MRDVASLFRALGDETRLRMLLLLFEQRELCVCDFMETLGITQSKASRHLRTLYHAGLVSDRRQGLWSYYSLRPPQDALAAAQLRVLRKTLGELPEATEIVVQLERWLARKERERARCA